MGHHGHGEKAEQIGEPKGEFGDAIHFVVVIAFKFPVEIIGAGM